VVDICGIVAGCHYAADVYQFDLTAVQGHPSQMDDLELL